MKTWGWLWVAGWMLAVGCSDRHDAVPAKPADGSAQHVGEGGDTTNPDPVHVRVKGSAQKGPLVAGSSVSVFGLDSALEPTGTVFPSQTEDNLGSFDVSANLTEEFVEVVVQGAFYDELTRKLSETSIVLRALALPDANLRVNLLTTISKNRVRYLVRHGQAFDAAVDQAEHEVLSAFRIEDDSLDAFTVMDITGSTASDAALIAVSAILLQYADDHSDSEGEKVAQLGRAVSSIASDLEQDGLLDDTGLGDDIARAAKRLDVGVVTANLTEIYSRLGQSLSVPDIGPFVAAVAGTGDVPDPDAVDVQVTGRTQNGQGADVSVLGLDSTLVPTATVFRSQTNGRGSFEVSTKLPEKFIEVAVQGRLLYLLDVLGDFSDGNIAFRALAAAASKTDIGVNLLTTLAANRIRHLVGQGQAFDAAVARAEADVLGAFGIDDDGLAPFARMDSVGSSASDAALIAVSTILERYAAERADLGRDRFSNLVLAISSIASDLEQDGVLDGKLRRDLATAAFHLYMPGVKASLVQVYSRFGDAPPVPPDVEPFVTAAASSLPWHFVTPMPFGRTSHCACAVGDKIFVIGGNASFSPIDDVLQYALATGHWEPNAPSSTPRVLSACSVVDGIVYVTGGVEVMGGVGSGVYLDTTEAYDPVPDAWTSKSAMPLARFGHASATLDGKIYVVGGADASSQPIDSVVVYDPTQDAWEPVAPLPKRLQSLALAAVSGRIYAFGGHDGTALSSAAVYEYDPFADTWTERASMGTSRREATAVALGGKIYVIGGDDEKRVGTVEEYDPGTNTWTTKTPMNAPRYSATGVVLGDLAYVIGGTIWDDHFRVGEVETYDPTKGE